MKMVETSRRRASRRAAVLIALAGCASAADAHIMQVAYNLPVPLWMYAYGATAALVASFVVVGYLVRAEGTTAAPKTIELDGPVARALGSPALVGTLRTLSVALLALSIVAGWRGTRSAEANFTITFFWIAFVLGATYLTALLGDFYAVLSPWRVLIEWLERWRPGLFQGRWPYPAWLAYFPALGLYLAFIWLELFGHTTPKSLAVVLCGYTALNFALAWAFGKSAWLRYVELFAVFLRLVALLAPVEIVAGDASRRGLRFRLRPPFAGLKTGRAEHFSLLLFILFMLSSTAFDGVHETVPWVGIFWKYLYPVLESATGQPYRVLVNVFYYWQWLMLLLAPFIYLAIYYAFIGLAKLVTRTEIPLKALALAFAFSLIPIAFVYHATHYFTLLLAQGPAIVALLSDPFGVGSNLFGTRGLFREGILLEAGTIWHTQVWLILLGHIVSVYLSHLEALRVFKSSRQATLSQAPLLVLMVALTTIGLWILSLPIAAGQVLLPPTSPG